MSWSVNAKGTPAKVKDALLAQFVSPLGNSGLSDVGEKLTVSLVRDVIVQCLDTFDPAKAVSVSANGHMGYADSVKKTGAYQEVTLRIAPV